ncbi:uncharacterized protein LOC141605644 isoform X2 [Silene latifolia]|uniref:uncharacterized protein LOC141605644 isoform X2 n=1 Tax=Silene latifolia TaxID=37657 RepID=UPI003D76FEBC
MTTAIDADDGSLHFLEIEGATKKERWSRVGRVFGVKYKLTVGESPVVSSLELRLINDINVRRAEGPALTTATVAFFCCGPFAKCSIASIPRTRVNKKKAQKSGDNPEHCKLTTCYDSAGHMWICGVRKVTYVAYCYCTHGS